MVGDPCGGRTHGSSDQHFAQLHQPSTSMNMSARRAMDMAASIGDAQSGRPAKNYTYRRRVDWTAASVNRAHGAGTAGTLASAPGRRPGLPPWPPTRARITRGRRAASHRGRSAGERRAGADGAGDAASSVNAVGLLGRHLRPHLPGASAIHDVRVDLGDLGGPAVPADRLDPPVLDAGEQLGVRRTAWEGWRKPIIARG